MSVMNLRFIQGICHQVVTQILTHPTYIRNLPKLYDGRNVDSPNCGFSLDPQCLQANAGLLP